MKKETFTAETLETANHQNRAEKCILIPSDLQLQNIMSLKLLGLFTASFVFRIIDIIYLELRP